MCEKSSSGPRSDIRVADRGPCAVPEPGLDLVRFLRVAGAGEDGQAIGNAEIAGEPADRLGGLHAPGARIERDEKRVHASKGAPAQMFEARLPVDDDGLSRRLDQPPQHRFQDSGFVAVAALPATSGPSKHDQPVAASPGHAWNGNIVENGVDLLEGSMRRKRLANISANVLMMAMLLIAAEPMAARAQRAKDIDALGVKLSQLAERGKYAEAIPIAERALPLAERVFGKDHPKTLSFLHELGTLYVGLAACRT